ncbi:hypothetical protein [Streptomyces noursei]|uniref:hypothetical protein n=1 Tax=Streptomyces noursei TaxID=1971 RepID=UPI00069D579C|nr:hypothetical protein [Streptomyces noursei]
MVKLATRRSIAAVALVTAAISATPAHAATVPNRSAAAIQTAGCPGDGRTDGGNTCTSLSSGAVFHTKVLGANVTITTSYKKESGGTITAQIGYSYKGTSHWSGQFSQSAGTTKYQSWTNYDSAFRCAPTIGLLQVSGQGTFQTPVATC